MSDEKVVLVICSTLNQITNYMMIDKFNNNISKIVNITIDDDENKNEMMKNKFWDENLKNVINKKYSNIKFEEIIICQNELLEEKIFYNNNSDNKDKKKILDLNNDEKIIWHITGGQRPLLVNIINVCREKNRTNDEFYYLEGNTHKLLRFKLEDNKNGISVLENKDYYCDNLDLEIALNLCGFRTISKQCGNNINLLKKDDNDEVKIKSKIYNEIYKKLISKECIKIDEFKVVIKDESKSKTLKDFKYTDKIKIDEIEEISYRDILILTNFIKEEKDNLRKEVIKTLIQKLTGDNEDTGVITKEIKSNYPAGWLLEQVVGYKLKQAIEDYYNVINEESKLNALHLNYKIKHKSRTNDNDVIIDDTVLDELDVVLLTNSGQVINFECKSGGMSGDNSKSHRFTTYSVSGVFGLPILMTPLLESEIGSLNELDKTYYDNIKSAVKSGARAGLEIWGLDKIEEKIKKVLNRMED